MTDKTQQKIHSQKLSRSIRQTILRAPYLLGLPIIYTVLFIFSWIALRKWTILGNLHGLWTLLAWLFIARIFSFALQITVAEIAELKFSGKRLDFWTLLTWPLIRPARSLKIAWLSLWHRNADFAPCILTREGDMPLQRLKRRVKDVGKDNRIRTFRRRDFFLEASVLTSIVLTATLPLFVSFGVVDERVILGVFGAMIFFVILFMSYSAIRRAYSNHALYLWIVDGIPPEFPDQNEQSLSWKTA